MDIPIEQHFDLSQYPEPQKSTIIASLSELVLLKLARQLYSELDPTEQAHFDQMNDETSEHLSEENWRYFNQRFPDMNQRIIDLTKAEQANLQSKLDAMLDLIHQQAKASQ